jgi:hypothetical protein
MTRLLFVLGVATVAALTAPRSAGAGFHSRVGVIVGAPCPAPVFPIYARPVVYPPPIYSAPIVAYPPAYYPYAYPPAYYPYAYPTPYYPRPYYGYYYRPDDHGRRVIGYTFPGRR